MLVFWYARWQTYAGGRHAPGVLPRRKEHVKRIGRTGRCCTLTRLLWRHTACNRATRGPGWMAIIP